MPTKAQAFRTEAARNAKPDKPPQPRRKPRASGPDSRSHAGRRGGAELEVSATRPSRKSTRGSSDGTKRTTNQQLKAQRESTAPTARATRGARGTAKVTAPAPAPRARAARTRGPAGPRR